MDNIGRREALGWLSRLPLWAALALAAVQQACMGDAMTSQYPTGGLMSCPNASCSGKVPMMDIHCHPTCLPTADFGSMTNVTLLMDVGNVGHTHNVTLTPQQLTTLQSGGSVTVTSTVDAAGTHYHSVKFG